VGSHLGATEGLLPAFWPSDVARLVPTPPSPAVALSGRFAGAYHTACATRQLVATSS